MKSIELTRGMFAVVDDDDHERVSCRKWYAAVGGKMRTCYAARTENRDGHKKANVLMHREIVGAGPGDYVDHIDGNGLNNTRANLRVVTVRQNAQNRTRKCAVASSRYKGVHWNSKAMTWDAKIRAGSDDADGRAHTLCLGSFQSEEYAARVYDCAARHYFGEFAALNLPLEPVLDWGEIEPNLGRKIGQRAYQARITEDDVKAIRILRDCGYMLRELSAQFGVSMGCIKGACGGRAWKSISRDVGALVRELW